MSLGFLLFHKMILRFLFYFLYQNVNWWEDFRSDNEPRQPFLILDLMNDFYREFSIFYIGTKSGHVYKVSQWTDDDGKLQSQLLDSFQGTAEEEPIR